MEDAEARYLKSIKLFDNVQGDKNRIPSLRDVPPCPFCGKQPKLIFHETEIYGCLKQVRCTNPECKVRPFTNCCEKTEEAKAIWSKRA